MKPKFTFVLALLISVISFAQSGINYKAIIKDGGGNILANQSVGVQFIIYEGAGLTNNVYQEGHSTTTDSNGIIILNIGEGITLDVFKNVDWGNDEHYLNVQVDAGIGPVDMGTTQFMAVPYALHADTAGDKAFKSEGGITSSENLEDDFVFGSIQLDNDPAISSDNIRFFFSQVKGAFRAGATEPSIGGTEWDDLNLGIGSFAVGVNTIASGNWSTAMGLLTNATYECATAIGRQTTASSFCSTAMGYFSNAFGSSSTAMGYNTLASGAVSTAMGRNTTASGSGSIAMGGNTTAPSFTETVVGAFNTSYTLASTNGPGDINWNPTDRLFVVGNGTSMAARSNALTILKNGNVGIGTSTPSQKLEVNGQIKFGDQEYIAAGTGDWDIILNGSLRSVVDNEDNLGSPSFRYKTVYAANGTINTSDRRDKDNIRALSYGIKEIMKLKPVSFTWKRDNEARVKLGLIAQDLQKVIKEVVVDQEWEYDEETGERKNNPAERLGVYYSDLIPVLIKAIQEQQKIISEQASKIEVLEAKLSENETRMEKVEALLKVN